ncbi:S8 family serine peptidase [Streptomyces sp. NPDC017936]|uniref:S8 family serine peptidase n=1 Tax=Streptomyces sp. NPDC017936 TaxID=3365016 RepID=UPI0037946B99
MTTRYPLELARDPDTVVTLDRTRLLLAFRAPQHLDALSPRLRQVDMGLEPSAPVPGSGLGPSETVNHTERRFWVRSLSGDIDDELHNAIEAEFDDALEWIAPVYHHPLAPGRAGLHCPVPDVLLVKDEEAPPPSDIELREDADTSRDLPGYRCYIIADPRSHPAHEVRAQLLEQESYDDDAVLLSTMPLLLPYSFEPADTFYQPDPSIGYGGQWNLVRIRAGGPGRTAWDLQMGVSTITIAVIDSGSDLTHSDLRHVAGTGGPNNDGSNNPHLPRYARGHGTMVAGVAAAITHNLKGTSGVAGGCSVMPLCFNTNHTDTDAAALISFAVTNGARVINMSWNAPGWQGSVIIHRALDRAHTDNVVLCAASGNDGAALVFPATGSHVIAVGSSDRNDARVSDSNYGSGLSVVAPGDGVPTTMLKGEGDEDLQDLGRRDWVKAFKGTSAATPHVSGIAALLLSSDPTITPDEVRAVIEGTADRAGPAVYQPGSTNGPWSIHQGHGRVNALDALLATLPARLRR